MTRLICCLLLVNSYCSLHTQDVRRYEYSSEKMGTTFRIIFFTADELIADTAINDCWNTVDRLNEIFSDYSVSSEITKLSESAGTEKFVPVSLDLWRVLRWADTLSHRTRGAFDVTIGPLSKYWRRAIRHQELPTKRDLEELQQAVGYNMIDYDSLTMGVRLNQRNMRLDFGGIAKGYTVDQLVSTLKSYNITQLLVDGGGDLYAGDPPPGKDGWQIRLFESETPLMISHQAVASSGDTYKHLVWNEVRYSHIVDPRSGMGVSDESIIYVTSSDCMTADALASTVAVLGIQNSASLLEQYPGSSINIP